MVPPNILEGLRTFVVKNLGHYVDLLAESVEIPSVSARGEGIEDAADFVARELRKRGFEVEVGSSGGHPIVLGVLGGRGRRSVLIYNHYDVQPPEPLEEWLSDPFRLTRRGNLLVARGVADNKGNIIARLAAIDALHDVLGDVPLTVKFIVEGEEEIGSPTLHSFVKQRAEVFRAMAVYGRQVTCLRMGGSSYTWASRACST